ncbi:iron-containing alcohol dehydrogenase [Desulfovibrio aerotolerans]|uniref:Iron-containing alcohol dehydrogenase n=1 Tax=Solidesulfovibrio aerotolerans TaxID=295255 RepID=A0A7C9ILE2_9BACT|nr:iron-containing alcohol dehydrogenase [Solidesulfovibrio aerotolerans]MYL83525.1 iron-containing alcohol dehydrogenase [Solidesulfovibrio aerotolerans]
MHFTFQTPGKVVFGRDTARQLPQLTAGLGRAPLVITGANPDRHAGLLEALTQAGLAVTRFSVAGEPTVATAMAGALLARENGCDIVIGLGGGGALDAAKAVAALATNTEDIFTYLEVVGAGRPLTERPLPVLAVPTTAGTGAEATANAVLTVPGERVKVSLRSPLMLPAVALIDPLLTVSMPPAVTAATGLDALTQLLEAFVSNKANPMTDALCREGLTRAARSLAAAYADGSNCDAREDMALASLLGGMALANAKLGAVHGFAAPLGGLFNAPHGQICASLLPVVTAANIRALRSRAPASPALAAYATAAAIVTGTPNATPEDGVVWLAALCRQLAAPTLAQLGVTSSDIPLVVAKAAQASSMQGNPIALTETELTAIVTTALG